MLTPLRQVDLDSAFVTFSQILKGPQDDSIVRHEAGILLDGFSAAVQLDTRVPPALRFFDSLCDAQADKARLISDSCLLREAMPPNPADDPDPPKRVGLLGQLIEQDPNVHGHRDLLILVLNLDAGKYGPDSRPSAISALERIYAKIYRRWHPSVDAILPSTWRQEWANRGVACVLIDTFPYERDRIHPADWHLYRAVRSVVQFASDEEIRREDVAIALENYLALRPATRARRDSPTTGNFGPAVNAKKPLPSWVHGMGVEPPPEFCGEQSGVQHGPLVGSQTEIGYTLLTNRSGKHEAVCKRASRRAAECAAKNQPPIWVRDAGGRGYEAFYRTHAKYEAALVALAEFRQLAKSSPSTDTDGHARTRDSQKPIGGLVRGQ